MDINWTSLLTGITGGIIPAAVAYYMGKQNVEASLAINKAKIDADKEALEIKYGQEMKKLRYEQRKKICADFLSTINPHIVGIGEFNITQSVFFYNIICLECPLEYAFCAKNMQELLLSNEAIQWSFGKKIIPDTDEYKNLMTAMNLFLPFYNMFIIITQEMLNEKELPTPGKWNLNDFEGSVPPDYQNFLTHASRQVLVTH